MANNFEILIPVSFKLHTGFWNYLLSVLTKLSFSHLSGTRHLIKVTCPIQKVTIVPKYGYLFRIVSM